jgi:multiple antibiotic resistance protein
MTTVTAQAFFLALSALISIVNPIGSALIFAQITAHRTHSERTFLARRIALYAALVMVGALWIGSPLLAFFGVSLAALRVAGGFVVAASAWTLLNAPEQSEAQRESQASSADGAADVAFFPLTLPFTTGPGTISVAIALSSNGPADGPGLVSFVVATTAAAVTVAVCVGVAYTWADKLVALLGRGGARVVTRLSAFLLLCVGVEIVLNGIAGFVRGIHG